MVRGHVLHVLDRTTGGVPVAVASYIRNSAKGIEHSVALPRTGDGAASVFSSLGAATYELGQGHLTRIRSIRRLVRALDPSAVHAHSSISGVYARVSLSRFRHRLIYTPHCFAFVRSDLSRPQRSAIWLAEAILGANTTAVAACSPGEADAARSLKTLRHRVNLVSNVPSVPPATSMITSRWTDGPLRVGMMGRVSPQKDPSYFIDVINDLKQRVSTVDAMWIGEGERSREAALRNAGIEVTGWLAAAEVSAHLATLHAYIHSAAWEGFPIAVLDAHAQRVPILVRSTPSNRDLPTSLTVEGSIAELFSAVTSPAAFRMWSEKNLSRWDEYLSGNTPEEQQRQLALVWHG